MQLKFRTTLFYLLAVAPFWYFSTRLSANSGAFNQSESAGQKVRILLDTAGSAAAPAAKCRKVLREGFMAFPLNAYDEWLTRLDVAVLRARTIRTPYRYSETSEGSCIEANAPGRFYDGAGSQGQMSRIRSG